MKNCFHTDVVVWSNQRVIRWVQKIGLREYAHKLTGSGIHGAFIALDDSFDAQSMGLYMQIPTQDSQVRLGQASQIARFYSQSSFNLTFHFLALLDF